MANSLKEPGKLLFAGGSINLDEVLLEQLDHYIAVENYLTDDDELPPNATNLEQVSGYQEALAKECQELKEQLLCDCE